MVEFFFTGFSSSFTCGESWRRAIEINESILCVPLWRHIKFFFFFFWWETCVPLMCFMLRGETEIPLQCIYSREVIVDHLLGDVLPLYPHHMEEYKDLILKRVILAPTNKESHQLNEEILAEL